MVGAATAASRVVFSGIQPTGIPHLGNYVGALKQWVQRQNDEPKDSKLIYSIVDLHAITVPQSPEKLKRSKREAMAALLAIGINPDRAIMFHQSAVPAHSELMWILACTASVGYLSRMTQWKQKLNLSDKSKLGDSPVGSNLKLGLFSYPVLQAADILVHRATHVPVGDDQKQHLEFARECVTNFNNTYGPHLVYPVTITAPVKRVMSLVDPTSKMSKSHKLERSRILLTDTPEEIRSKISSALTDSTPGISYEPSQRPGVSNLLDIMSIFDSDGRSPTALAETYANTSPKAFKTDVADATIQGLSGIRERYLDLLDNESYIEQVEAEGAKKARQSAEETMHLVRTAIGF